MLLQLLTIMMTMKIMKLAVSQIMTVINTLMDGSTANNLYRVSQEILAYLSIIQLYVDSLKKTVFKSSMKNRLVIIIILTVFHLQ